MIGVEIDMFVSDSLKALELYERIFEIQPVEVSSFPKGENEVVFTLFGTRFHMLDENEEFGLKAPAPDKPNTIWFNVLVPDINETYSKAIDAGCTEVQPITEMPEFGISGATFIDPFGYVWMVHQVHREISYEERIRILEERRKGNK